MSSESAKQKAKSWHVIAIVAILFSAIMGVGSAIAGDNPKLGVAIFAVGIGVSIAVTLLICVDLWLAIVWHELGHLIAGWLNGFTFRSVEVWNWGIKRTRRGLAFYKAVGHAGGGLATMDFPDSPHLVRKYRNYILGGRIATYIAFGLSIGLYWISLRALGPGGWGAVLVLNCFLLLLAQVTMLFYAFSHKPWSGFPTDAMLLKMLRDDPDLLMGDLAIGRLGFEIREGILPRDWSPRMLEVCRSLSNGSMTEARGRYLRYYYLADLGNERGAYAEIERADEVVKALGESAGFFLGLMKWERYYASVRLSGEANEDLEGESGEPQEFVEPTRLRALAAASLTRKEYEAALAHIERSRALTLAFNEKYDLESVTDLAWLDGLESEAWAHLP